MKKKRSNMVLTITLVTTVIFSCVSVASGADPVYSPTSLSDTSGNTADSASQVTWSDLPAGEPYETGESTRVSSGQEAYYDLVHSFIRSVFSKGIPDDIIEKAADGDLGSVASSYNDYIMYLLGYAICVTIGILFMIIFPIVGCCLCCCRCCGNCGGKMDQNEKDASNTCKKYTFAIILFVSLAFLLTGCICIYVNNENMSTALNSITPVTKENLGDVKTFLNNTVKQATHIGRTNYEFLKTAINRDLDNIGFLVGLPVRVDIETNTDITATLATATALGASVNSIDIALTGVETSKANLVTSIDELNTKMAAHKTALDNVFTACGGSCPAAGKPDYATLSSSGVDTSKLPDLSASRTSMDDAKTKNLTAKVADAQAELDNIPETVENDSLSSRNTMKTNLNKMSDDIDPMIDNIEDLNNVVSGDNATLDLDKLTEDIDDYGETIRTYDNYRRYAGLGLASIVLLVVGLAFLGMVFGVLGTSMSTDPTRRGCLSNCGGIMLMASTAVVFIFGTLLMLLTTVPFLIGAPMQRFVCDPVTDLEQLEELTKIYNDHSVGEGKYFLGKELFNNDTTAITVTGMLKDCRDGKAAYEAFHLEHQFNLSDILNYSKTLDVQKEVDSINVDLTTVEIYPASLKTTLTDLKDAVNINFTEFYIELGKPITTKNLNDLADELNTYAAGVPDPAKTDLLAEAIAIRATNNEEYAYVQTNLTALNTSVAAMETAVADIPSQVDSLDLGLNVTDTYIQTNTSGVINTLLTTYVTRITGIADSYVAFTDSAVTKQMGQCQPIWNAYNRMLVYLFCYNIMDTFNGFWFSLGWCLFFFMFSIIFSVKLAKYFRRMQPGPDDQDPPDYKTAVYSPGHNPEVSPMPSKPQLWMRNNKVHHYDKDSWRQDVDNLYATDSVMPAPKPVLPPIGGPATVEKIGNAPSPGTAEAADQTADAHDHIVAIVKQEGNNATADDGHLALGNETKPEAGNAPTETKPEAGNASLETNPKAGNASPETKPEAGNASPETKPEAGNASPEGGFINISILPAGDDAADGVSFAVAEGSTGPADDKLGTTGRSVPDDTLNNSRTSDAENITTTDETSSGIGAPSKLTKIDC